MSAIIVAENLTRGYGPRRGIVRVNLAVPEGRIFGFLGPNGAGKSTAIRVLLGFLRPTSGGAKILGLDCWRNSARIKRDVGYLPGDLRLPAYFSLDRALDLFASIRGRGGEMITHGRTLAQRLELDARVNVRNMSRGMRQKLGLILSLAHQPRLLILDEPTSALDPLMQRVVHAIVRERAAAGCTIFFSSHTLSEVEQLCDRVAIVREGQIVADDTLDALRERAGHEVVIRWKDPHLGGQLQPPPILTLESRQGALWTGRVDGPLDPLVRWLAQHAIDDLTIGRPDLESLFRRYYQTGGKVSS